MEAFGYYRVAGLYP